MKKRIVIALGHRALGTTLPEQKKAVKTSASVLADMVEEGYQLVTVSEMAAAKKQDLKDGTAYSDFTN